MARARNPFEGWGEPGQHGALTPTWGAGFKSTNSFFQSGHTRGRIDIHIMFTRDAAVSEVIYAGWAGVLKGYGSSKRNKGEEFSTKVGQRLATSRALEDLARKIREDLAEDVDLGGE